MPFLRTTVVAGKHSSPSSSEEIKPLLIDWKAVSAGNAEPKIVFHARQTSAAKACSGSVNLIVALVSIKSAPGRLRRIGATCCLVLLAFFSVIASAQTSNTRGLDNNEIKRRGVAQVAVHDLSIPVGLLPFPAIQYAAEAVEMGSNITLKALPPRLLAPAGKTVEPAPGECTYSFNLASTQGGYENLYGFWESVDYEDPNWGGLGAPDVSHWNTAVDVFVDTPLEVEFLDGSSPPRRPLGPDGDFLFPIGEHRVLWTANTKLNIFSDVAAPSIMLAVGLLTELKNAAAAASFANKSKDDLIEAISKVGNKPKPSAAVTRRTNTFKQLWQDTWTKPKEDVKKILKREGNTSALKKKLAGKVMCRSIPVVEGIIRELLSKNYEVWDGSIPASLLPDVNRRTLGELALDEWAILYAETQLETILQQIQIPLCTDPNELSDKLFEIFIGTILKFVGKLPLDGIFEKTTATSYAYQPFNVLDTEPPTIYVDPGTVTLEATTPDGIPGYRAQQRLLEIAPPVVNDNCGRTPEVFSDLPDTLELQQKGDDPHVVTWTARDQGPNPAGSPLDFSPTATQFVQVLDLEPPLLLTPPPVVYISRAGATEVSRELLEEEKPIGRALATDLVDVTPTIENDIPARFPVNKRTIVTWKATDDSRNTASAGQMITVKDNNTAPEATDGIYASTVTTEPVPIRLTGMDPDILDGRADPLWFQIESYPSSGEFVAPLNPFFIDDLRRDSSDVFPEALNVYLRDNNCGERRAQCVRDFVKQEYCEPGGRYFQEPPPRGFVFDPRSLQVDDNGAQYFVDSYMKCPGNQDVEVYARISKWSKDHGYLGQINFDSPDFVPLNGSVRLDAENNIELVIRASSTDKLLVYRCGSEFESFPENNQDYNSACSELDVIDESDLENAAFCNVLSLDKTEFARWDTAGNLLYVATARSIYAFANQGGSLAPVTEIGPQDASPDPACPVADRWLGKVSGLEVAKDGSVYVADGNYSRIHKLEPALAGRAASPIASRYIGWAGKCNDSNNKACNEKEMRTRGYSCTATTCDTILDDYGTTGSAPGQFDDITYIELDPRGVLYVADYGNSRVQRFSPDGQFAGEAASTGTGINEGEKPSFVLGNFGKPEIVAVTSSQLHIIGNTDEFVHLFETLPFTDISEDGVTVTYKSDEDMPFPDDEAQDSFVFSVSDGDLSDQATVLIDVSRHYRAPISYPQDVVVAEDSAVDILLEADDPDGIRDIDFYGRDILSYEITQAPAHGRLTDDGSERRYTPDPDFFGLDSFSFRVNDGRDDSNEAVVSILVTPVNDPPELTLDVPERVGVGFPVLMTASFTDDDVYPGSDMDPGGSPVSTEDEGSHYQASLRWSQRAISLSGRFNDDDIDNPYIEGVAIADPPAFGLEGRLFAEHTYESAGVKTITGCVVDKFLAAHCDSVQVQAEELVRIQLNVQVDEVRDPGAEESDEYVLEVEDGRPFYYEFSVLNSKPEFPDSRPAAPAFAGLTARAVKLSVDLPEGLSFLDLEYPSGVSCQRAGLKLDCRFGDLPPAEPEQALTVRLLARSSGLMNSGKEVEVYAELTTDSAALDSEIGQVFNLYLDARDTDEDGMSDVYEQKYGFNPLLDDSADDADRDGLTNLEEFDLGTIPIVADTDMDGLGDGEEANALGTDPLNPDSDGDNIPDGWEHRNGLDPLNAADANLDSDGDGLTNLEEFLRDTNPIRDDIPPLVTAPQDMTVSSTGVLTPINLGQATAIDGRDGPLTAVSNLTSPFRSGRHEIIWSATDRSGNRGEDLQILKVIPQANFSAGQVVPEGSKATVRAELIGPAADYPVVIPVTIEGSASAENDYVASDGEILIELGLIGNLEISILNDRVEDPDEDILIQMGEPDNAIPGDLTTHRILISEKNMPPLVDIDIEQDQRTGNTLVASGGAISVSVVISDNAGDEHSVDWSKSDAGIFDPAAMAEQVFTLNPALLEPGFYFLRVAVRDNAPIPATTEVSALVQVLADPPVLGSMADSDGDGVVDSEEGFGDSDGDRIPDYLDAENSPALLPLVLPKLYLQTTTGNSLRLGDTGFRRGVSTALISESLLKHDVNFGYPNGLVDLVVVLGEVGGTSELVVPLMMPLADKARFRLYDGVKWRDLVASEDDIETSAPGENGACPGPGSELYRTGFIAGNNCVQLIVKDGGPNDADGVANGMVSLLGGAAVPVNVRYTQVENPKLRTDGADDRVLGELMLESTSGDVELHSLVFVLGKTAPVKDNYKISLATVVEKDRGNYVLGRALAETAIGPGAGEIRLKLEPPYIVQPGTTRLALILHRKPSQ